MSSFTVFLYDAKTAIYKAMQCTKDENKQLGLKEIDEKISHLMRNSIENKEDEKDKKNKALLRQHIDGYESDGDRCRCEVFRWKVAVEGIHRYYDYTDVPVDFSTYRKFIVSNECICHRSNNN